MVRRKGDTGEAMTPKIKYMKMVHQIATDIAKREGTEKPSVTHLVYALLDQLAEAHRANAETVDHVKNLEAELEALRRAIQPEHTPGKIVVVS